MPYTGNGFMPRKSAGAVSGGGYESNLPDQRILLYHERDVLLPERDLFPDEWTLFPDKWTLLHYEWNLLLCT